MDTQKYIGKCSDDGKCMYILGPTLFITFIDEVVDKNISASLKLFADDAKLFSISVSHEFIVSGYECRDYEYQHGFA